MTVYARTCCRGRNRTFERAVGGQGLLQLLVDLPVEGPPDGCDVGLSPGLQVHLLAKLLNDKGLA